MVRVSVLMVVMISIVGMMSSIGDGGFGTNSSSHLNFGDDKTKVGCSDNTAGADGNSNYDGGPKKGSDVDANDNDFDGDDADSHGDNNNNNVPYGDKNYGDGNDADSGSNDEGGDNADGDTKDGGRDDGDDKDHIRFRRSWWCMKTYMIIFRKYVHVFQELFNVVWWINSRLKII